MLWNVATAAQDSRESREGEKKVNYSSDQLLPIVEIDSNMLSTMTDELHNSTYAFNASKYWEVLNQLNLDQLNTYGLNNFKRTVNQNYFNALPGGFGDNQMKSLMSFWAKEPSSTALNVQIKAPRFLQPIATTKNLFLNGEYAEIYRLFVELLWHYTEKTDQYGISAELAEPGLGNAIQTRLDGRLISQDLANSIRERNANFEFFAKNQGKTYRVAELGAGYGRLGHVFLETTNCRYYIFDIPPALMVSQWYLSNLMSEKEVFAFRHFENFEDVRQEIAAADVGFFTPNQLELFPARYFDSLVSISSLHEMTVEQIDAYKKIIQEKVDKTVYFKQWISTWVPFLDIRLEKAMYTLDEDWEIALDRTDAVHDKFFETLFCRKN